MGILRRFTSTALKSGMKPDSLIFNLIVGRTGSSLCACLPLSLVRGLGLISSFLRCTLVLILFSRIVSSSTTTLV